METCFCDSNPQLIAHEATSRLLQHTSKLLRMKLPRRLCHVKQLILKHPVLKGIVAFHSCSVHSDGQNFLRKYIKSNDTYFSFPAPQARNRYLLQGAFHIPHTVVHHYTGESSQVNAGIANEVQTVSEAPVRITAVFFHTTKVRRSPTCSH